MTQPSAACPLPLPYMQDLSDCFADKIGSQGIDRADWQALRPRLLTAINHIAQGYRSGEMAFLQLVDASQDLQCAEPVVARLRADFTDILIFGTGGSSLGGRALYELADYRNQTNGPKLHIITNIDPFVFEGLIERLDFRKTAVVAISKSGHTTETLMQLAMVLPLIEQAVGAADLARHIVVITEAGNSPLARMAKERGFTQLDHPARVGGRYSVLSIVGMLPTMLAGLDPFAVRAGGRIVLEDFLAAADPGRDPLASPPCAGAATHHLLAEKSGITATVMLAYSDRLGSFARWYRQLWAESLGKQGKGTTPIYGTGPVDQHSQLQLWLDGPADKMFTVLGADNHMARYHVSPQYLPEGAVDYLAGCSMADLMDASRRATAETLAAQGKPVRRITLPVMDEKIIGMLMMHFMLETVVSAHLLGVDPFDQPAVEDGKKRIQNYMRNRNQPHRTGEKA